MDFQKIEKIWELVDSEICSKGFECIEVEWLMQDRALRIFIDSIDSSKGVLLDDCVMVTRMLNEVTLLEEMIQGSFHLEVSSPGVERPLRLGKHFTKVIGSTIKVRLSQKSQDRRNGVGKLISVEENGIIKMELAEGGIWEFPISAIKKANLVYDWDQKK